MGKCTTVAMHSGPKVLLEVSPVHLHFSEFFSAHIFCVCFVGWNGICTVCNLFCSVELASGYFTIMVVVVVMILRNVHLICAS